LITFGFETEFIGRLPVMVRLSPLGVEELFAILKSKNNAVVEGKRRDFLSYGIKLEFAEDALRVLAEQAAQEGTGARGILAVMEKLLMPFEKRLPGKVTQLTVTRELVLNPIATLQTLLEQAAIFQFQRDILAEFGLAFVLSESAQKWAHNHAATENVGVVTLLKERLKNYPYGLKLLGLTAFEITEEALENPQEYLDTKIKTTFAQQKG